MVEQLIQHYYCESNHNDLLYALWFSDIFIEDVHWHVEFSFNRNAYFCDVDTNSLLLLRPYVSGFTHR